MTSFYEVNMTSCLPKIAICFQTLQFTFFLKRSADLVVIPVYTFLRLPQLNELWIDFRPGKRWNLFPSTKSAKFLDHPYVMDNLFFMILAVAIPYLHLAEKARIVF